MPQKILTKLKLDAVTTIADVLKRSAEDLEQIAKHAADLGVTELEIANWANTTEAVRRVQVFVSSADQALFGKRLDDTTIN